MQNFVLFTTSAYNVFNLLVAAYVGYKLVTTKKSIILVACDSLTWRA